MKKILREKQKEKFLSRPSEITRNNSNFQAQTGVEISRARGAKYKGPQSEISDFEFFCVIDSGHDLTGLHFRDPVPARTVAFEFK